MRLLNTCSAVSRLGRSLVISVSGLRLTRSIISPSHLAGEDAANDDKKCPAFIKDYIAGVAEEPGRDLSCSAVGKRLYKCVACKKVLAIKSSLVVHERIHTGSRPYRCVLCNQTFNQKVLLLRHERKHTGERPYKCVTCDQTFTEKRQLVVHERNTRENDLTSVSRVTKHSLKRET